MLSSVALVNRHRKSIFLYIKFRLGNHHDAEDATQTVFIDLHTTLINNKYKETNNFKGWLHLTSKYITSHIMRTKTKLVFKEELVIPINTAIEEVIINEIIFTKLFAVIEKLPIDDKKLVHLRFWKKQNWTQIGKALGIKEKSASKKLCEINRKLRSLFGIKNLQAFILRNSELSH